MVTGDPFAAATEMVSAVVDVIEGFQKFDLSSVPILEGVFDPASDLDRARALSDKLSSYEEMIEKLASAILDCDKITHPQTAPGVVYPLQNILDVIEGFKKFDAASVGELVAKLSTLSDGIREMISLMDEINSRLDVLGSFLDVLRSLEGFDLESDLQQTREKVSQLCSYQEGLEEFQSFQNRLHTLITTPDGHGVEVLTATTEANV